MKNILNKIGAVSKPVIFGAAFGAVLHRRLVPGRGFGRCHRCGWYRSGNQLDE